MSANLSGYTGSGFNNGLNWTSGQFTVSAGETIYFAIDPNHDYGQGSGLGARPEGNQDPISLQAIVNFTAPEPSSFVLLGMAGVGTALAAWKSPPSRLEIRDTRRRPALGGVH